MRNKTEKDQKNEIADIAIHKTGILTTNAQTQNQHVIIAKKENLDELFKNIFEPNRRIKDTEIKIHLKLGHQPIKQKARHIPYHLQNYVEKEIKNLFQSGHLEKIQKVQENCSVSPVVLTVEKDKSVKMELESRKLNNSCIEKKPRIRNMEELLNQRPTKKQENRKNHVNNEIRP